MRSIAFVGVLSLVALIVSSAGQASVGTVTGVVKDSAGAPVPGPRNRDFDPGRVGAPNTSALRVSGTAARKSRRFVSKS